MNETVQKILDFNQACDRVAGAYFWSHDNGNASIRNSREKYLSAHTEFEHKGSRYICDLDVTQSRKITYTRITITKDGARTTRTVFKKILRELGYTEPRKV